MAKEQVKIPLYQQLNELLRHLIREGQFKVNDQFLTERQICERFGVSRATANKALSNMVAAGVLEFKKGLGTFVRGETLDYDLRALVSFTHKALAAGKTPSTQILSYQILSAGQAEVDLIQPLELQPEDKLYEVKRLRLADNIPVILEWRYIVAKFCPGLSEAELVGSLYELWVERYKLPIAGANQTIRAVPVEGAEAALLGVIPGAPGLLVTSIGYLAEEVPLWWERTYYRGDAYEFQNRLGPIQAGPAAGALLDFKDETT
jgi:GntR family transcriptional regulator